MDGDVPTEEPAVPVLIRAPQRVSVGGHLIGVKQVCGGQGKYSWSLALGEIAKLDSKGGFDSIVCKYCKRNFKVNKNSLSSFAHHLRSHNIFGPKDHS